MNLTPTPSYPHQPRPSQVYPCPLTPLCFRFVVQNESHSNPVLPAEAAHILRPMKFAFSRNFHNNHSNLQARAHSPTAPKVRLFTICRVSYFFPPIRKCLRIPVTGPLH